MTTGRVPIQVVPAERDEASGAYRWFASSSWDDGHWYRVQLVPGAELVCSCRHGAIEAIRGALGNATGRACSHIAAVAAHAQAAREAVAS